MNRATTRGAGSGVLFAALALLIGAAILQWLPARAPTSSWSGSLGDAVPRDLAGWSAREEPLGETEARTARVSEVLQFDDYVHRSFTRGSAKFSVYAAFWRPGKLPLRAVREHTPDVCWTQAGAVLLARRTAIPWRGGDREFLPGEWRRFRLPDESPSDVLFWHVVGGRVFRFDERTAGQLFARMLREQAVGRQEQFFIRLAANVSLESLCGDAGFERVLTELGRLALWERKPPPR